MDNLTYLFTQFNPQVCQLWRNIVTRRTFWKDVFERNGARWDTIPQRIKEKDNLWMFSYWWLTRKDMVKNHSGHGTVLISFYNFVKDSMLILDGFKHWKRIESFGQKCIIEKPPVGIDPLPRDLHYGGMVDSAFVTSFDWAELRQKISLSKVGLVPEIMEVMTPFNFICKVM